MRYLIVGLLVSSLAFAADSKTAPKKAQVGKAIEGDDEGNDGDDNDDGGGPPEGSVRVVNPPADGKPSSAGTQHTVERGDTLWDLSQKYLGSPWYWPKVWSYNPEIANPHWIYPGNLVRFFAGGEETPTQVELGSVPAAEDMSGADRLDDDGVQVSGKIGYTPHGNLMFRVAGFVTKKEIEEAGVIRGSFEQQEYLASNMPIYVQFKNARQTKIGDRFVIYRTGNEISGGIGYITLVVGVARITKTEGPMVTAMITESYEAIERGDLLAPYSEALSKRVAAKANDRKLDGTIVAQIGIGTYTTMFVDQGSEQGVQVGNVFTVLRQQDGLSHEVGNNPAIYDDRYPIEEVGACVAWEVKQTVTSCVLVHAIREIVVGDWVQMKTGGAPAARASR